MSFWTAVVLIVLISAIAGVMGSRNQRSNTGELPDSQRRQLEHERDAAREELNQLKERVKVLERIATDPARRTADEIEKLRDQ